MVGNIVSVFTTNGKAREKVFETVKGNIEIHWPGKKSSKDFLPKEKGINEKLNQNGLERQSRKRYSDRYSGEILMYVHLYSQTQIQNRINNL